MQLIGAVRPDRLIHLGNGLRDLQTACKAYPSLPVLSVRGNNDDSFFNAPAEQTADICGKRIFMAHGHTYGVKLGLGRLLAAGRRRGADIVLFGHTHAPRCIHEGGMLVINPGSVFLSVSLRRTYGLLTIDQASGQVHANILPFGTR